MQKQILDQTHPSYDAERWEELGALAKGGKSFHKLIHKFLPQNPMEPDLRYHMRKKVAKYHSYIGSIINLYVAWVFAAGFEAKATTRGSSTPIATLDPFYGKFQEDVGPDVTLKSFMTDAFRDAMTKGKAVWVLELPQAPDDTPIQDRATYERLGLGNATLTKREPSELLDWAEDDRGQLQWCCLKTMWKERPTFKDKRDVVVEQWRYYDTETVTTFTLRYKESEPPSQETEVVGETTVHGFKRVPVIRLCLKEEMCVGEQTYDAQVSHFQHDNALSWAIKLTCYAVPIFHLQDKDDMPTLGAGYAIGLGPEEKLDWASPPTDSFDTIAKNRDSKRDEIFRIVHQMAQGMDNNAETVGRSADSKEIDAAATRIMLGAYGEEIAKAIECTYETISEARDDSSYEWSVEGFSGYDTATAGSLLANIAMVRTLGIPSQTLHKELSKKAATVLVPELDPRVKQRIREEIDASKIDVTAKTMEQQIIESKEKIAQSKDDTALQVSKNRDQTSLQVAKSRPAPKPPA